MSRPARFWLWTSIIIVLFVVGSPMLHYKLCFDIKETLLYSGIIAIVIWVIGLRFVIGSSGPLSRKKLRNPHLASPEEFELLCAAIFKKRGYNIELTGKGADFGVDIIARKKSLTIAIGAKRYSEDNPVGNRWVQQLLGAMFHFNADRAVLITSGRFTKQAVEQADDAPIELIDGDELRRIIAGYWL
ncbi:hypothetical protein DRQ36_08480 [bacterium]|nr:MAG: hypothetical protein DRQ36_08480 [bacterium]